MDEEAERDGEKEQEKECKRTGQGAIHLSGADRSPSRRIGYTRLVSAHQKASILHCSSRKWDLLPNKGGAGDGGERETQEW